MQSLNQVRRQSIVDTGDNRYYNKLDAIPDDKYNTVQNERYGAETGPTTAYPNALTPTPPSFVRASEAASALAKPSIIKSGTVGPLGVTDDSPEAALFEKHIAPHMDQDEFADHYFAGMHDPRYLKFQSSKWDDGMRFNGSLIKNGSSIASISRTIRPGVGNAHHGLLELNENSQGSNIAKSLLRNQVGLYGKMGLDNVDLYANINVGGYAWSKYGFLPTASSWDSVVPILSQRLSRFQGKIEPSDFNTARALISSRDPRAMWAISDMNTPAPIGSGYDTIGKGLLLDTGWNGLLHLKNTEAMDRFNAYVNRGR